MEKDHYWLLPVPFEVGCDVDVQDQAILVANEIAGENSVELRAHITERRGVANTSPRDRRSGRAPAEVSDWWSSEGNATEDANIAFNYTPN